MDKEKEKLSKEFPNTSERVREAVLSGRRKRASINKQDEADRDFGKTRYEASRSLSEYTDDQMKKGSMPDNTLFFGGFNQASNYKDNQSAAKEKLARLEKQKSAVGKKSGGVVKPRGYGMAHGGKACKMM